MKKFYAFFIALLAVCGLAQAQTTVTFTAGTDVYPSSDAGAHSLTKDGVTIAVSNGTFGRDDNYRIYKNQTLTVSSEAGAITKIVMNCTSSNPASNFEALDGLTVDGDNGIWAGSAAEVSFLASGAQVRMTSVEVTLGSADPNYVAKPTITPATGTYYSAQEVTITAGEGATVYYTTDGSEPTASSKAYTAPFTVSESTTVKAIAVKGENKSEVVESVITIETVTSQTIAELLAAGDADQATTSGTVYAVYPKGFLLGDNTGYIFVYGNNDLSVGALITITGKVSQYGGCYQISNATINQTGSASVTYPAAKSISGADLDALVAAPVVTFVKVKGTLTSTGNYKNFSVEGATVTGSILAPDAVFGETQVGDEIEVTGYFVYQSGSGKYGNILATEVKVTSGGETPDEKWNSSLEEPMTVARALELIATLEAGAMSPAQVYVKGKIAEISEISTQFGNATYSISDDGTTDNVLVVFRGKGFEGAAFTEEDALKVGDEVVVLGQLQNYVKNEVSTPEVATGSKLCLLNGDNGSHVASILGNNTRDAAIYTLAGQRVSKAVRGLYIVGSKKVFVQ